MNNIQKRAACIVAVVAATGVLFASEASAAYLYNWDLSPSMSITDLSADVSSTGQDITKAWYALQNDIAYFRMDLTAAPAKQANNYAERYGIYIDKDGNSFIDLSLVTNVNKDTSNIVFSTPLTALTFQHSEDKGKTLEWRITAADLAKLGLDVKKNFDWYAATQTSNGTTLDRTNTATTPIPGAAWLLGSGIFGLVGLKRRSKNTDRLPYD